jgi:hypothetical protein
MSDAPVRRIPKEIWSLVSQELSPLQLLHLSRVFRYSPTRDQQNHSRLWKAIFVDDKWLTEAEKKFRIKPVIIGPQLDRYYYSRGRRGPIYVAIAFRDPTGDFKQSIVWEEFLKVLRGCSGVDRNRSEVTLESGIVLNVHDLFVSQEFISVKPAQLFKGKKRLPSDTT